PGSAHLGIAACRNGAHDRADRPAAVPQDARGGIPGGVGKRKRTLDRWRSFMRELLTSITRRTLMAAAVSLAMAPAAAWAQADYPNDRITFVCAFPAGSGADVLVRYFADKVSKVSGQTVIVENKPGANGNIAAEYTVRA